MGKKNKAEELLQAWVTLSGIIKNCRITKGLQYNEAIIMNILHKQYIEDGEGKVSIKDIGQKTKMLKSLVNRTVNSLEKKELLERCKAEGDKRIAYVRCAKDKIDLFLSVHNGSLMHAENITEIIGEDNTNAFIDIVRRIDESGYVLK